MIKSLKSGFSLMEIMIAVAIMGLLAGIGGPMLFSYLKQGKVRQTEGNLSLLKNEINRYYADTGRYPRVLDDLVDKPDADDPLVKRWNGPYIDVKGGGVPTDGWDQDFQYEITPGGMHPYELYSFGPEGEEGPEEDRLNAW